MGRGAKGGGRSRIANRQKRLAAQRELKQMQGANRLERKANSINPQAEAQKAFNQEVGGLKFSNRINKQMGTSGRIYTDAEMKAAGNAAARKAHSAAVQQQGQMRSAAQAGQNPSQFRRSQAASRKAAQAEAKAAREAARKAKAAARSRPFQLPTNSAPLPGETKAQTLLRQARERHQMN